MQGSFRAGGLALGVLATIAAAGSVILAARGASGGAAAAFAVSGGAAYAIARLRTAAGRSDQASRGGRALQPPGAAPSSAREMTPEARLNAELVGTYGLVGQIHIAGLVLPPILLAGALALLVPEGHYLAAALAATIGLYLTRLGWIAGLKYDRLDPKTPSLEALDAGGPWVNLVILVAATSLFAWLAAEAFWANLAPEGLVISAMGLLGAAAGVRAARFLFRRRGRARL